MSGKLYIAAAGAGKTSKIIEDSLAQKDKKILILTYTNINEQQIIKRIKKKVGVIPTNITVSTWFSFLLKDGIRPYQGVRFKKRIEGIIFSEKNKYKVKKEDNLYYLNTDNNKIYLDKIPDCVIDLDKKSEGAVFERIAKMYDCIYIDEVQDMVGYDLEIIKSLIETDIEVIMLGDPRQCTYTTHKNKKHKKYEAGKIDEFLKNECKEARIEIDDKTLNITHRNNKEICEFANRLYPERTRIKSNREAVDDSEGIKIISKKDVDRYLNETQAVQLRYSKNVKINEKFSYYNFGEAKGLEFKDVVIYPTKDIWKWIIDNTIELESQTRAKFYVAITRARDSVVIVAKNIEKCGLPLVYPEENLEQKKLF